MGVKDENDDENPETTHESKGKRGRPPNVRKQIENTNTHYMTQKRI